MARSTTARTRRVALLAVVAASAGAVGVSALAPGAVVASSHREAPLISQDPLVDNTDTYVFNDPKDSSKVDIVANWVPFEFPAGGPNFYRFAPDANYNINIDNNGDGKPDVTYTWQFYDSRTPKGTFLYNNGLVTDVNDANLLYQQKYSIREVRAGSNKLVLKDAVVAPSFVGDSMPDYGKLRAQSLYTYGGSRKSFAGQAEDSFFLDLRIFDLLYGGALRKDGAAPVETGNDSLRRFNVQSIALQVPKSDLALNGNTSRNPVIGVWSTTNRRGFTVNPATGAKVNQGPYVQESRLGAPLVNEVVIPYNDKDKFNASSPADDGANFAKYILKSHVAELLNAVYKIGAPVENRTDLVAAFATGFPTINAHSLNKDAKQKAIVPAEELRLNLTLPYSLGGPPSRLGAFRVKKDGTLGVGADGGDTGFPNGRRLSDDVVDIELQAIAGVLLPTSKGGTGGKPVGPLTDRVDHNDVPFLTSFPYVALPASGSRGGSVG